MKKNCNFCGESLTKNCFSKTQWRKNAERKCAHCLIQLTLVSQVNVLAEQRKIREIDNGSAHKEYQAREKADKEKTDNLDKEKEKAKNEKVDKEKSNKEEIEKESQEMRERETKKELLKEKGTFGPFYLVTLTDLFNAGKITDRQDFRVYCEGAYYSGKIQVNQNTEKKVELVSNDWQDIVETTPGAVVRKIFERVAPQVSSAGRSWQSVSLKQQDETFVSLRKIRDRFVLDVLRNIPFARVSSNGNVELTRNLSEKELTNLHQQFKLLHIEPNIVSYSAHCGVPQGVQSHQIR